MTPERAAALRWLCQEYPTETAEMLLGLRLPFLCELELGKTYIALRNKEGGLGGNLSLRFDAGGTAHVEVMSWTGEERLNMHVQHFRVPLPDSRPSRIRTALLVLALAAHLES